MNKEGKKGAAKLFALAAVLLCFLFAAGAPAWSDIMIMPIRTVFKDRDRMKTIAIINTSDKPAVFRLSFYNQRQIETGGYELLKEPLDPAKDLSKMLVFSPRQVELPARGKQSVRLSVRRPEGLPDGEYRTHLKLSRITSERPKDTGKGAVAQLGINVGFSVPIILRKGKYDAKARISNPKYVPASFDGKKKKAAQVEMTLERTGIHSTLGKLRVFWTPVGGEERQVGVLNSVNVFTDISKRFARVLMQEENISGGTFRIVYEGDDADTGINFDEVTFPAP